MPYSFYFSSIGEWELKAPDWGGSMEDDQYLVIPVS